MCFKTGMRKNEEQEQINKKCDNIYTAYNINILYNTKGSKHRQCISNIRNSKITICPNRNNMYVHICAR